MIFDWFKRKDPICGMAEVKGKGIEQDNAWFCSQACVKAYNEQQKEKNSTTKSTTNSAKNGAKKQAQKNKNNHAAHSCCGGHHG